MNAYMYFNSMEQESSALQLINDVRDRDITEYYFFTYFASKFQGGML